LEAEDKALLQDAAVLGKLSWAGALAALGGREPTAVEQRLHALERRELLRRDRHSQVAGERQYSFRHLLVRDVAYGQLSPGPPAPSGTGGRPGAHHPRRRTLHLRRLRRGHRGRPAGHGHGRGHRSPGGARPGPQPRRLRPVDRGDADGVADLDPGVAVAEQLNSPARSVVLGNTASTMVVLGELGGAFELQAAAGQVAQRFGLALDLEWMRHERIAEDYWRGRWDAALAAADRLLAGADAGAEHFMEPVSRQMRAQIRLVRGDLQGAPWTTSTPPSRSLPRPGPPPPCPCSPSRPGPC
jgi:hypothetical protein